MHVCTRAASRVAVCGSNGSIVNHATAQMNHKLAHQAAFHQHSIGARLSNPRLIRCPEFTRERCEGFQRATPCVASKSVELACGSWWHRGGASWLGGWSRPPAPWRESGVASPPPSSLPARSPFGCVSLPTLASLLLLSTGVPWFKHVLRHTSPGPLPSPLAPFVCHRKKEDR